MSHPKKSKRIPLQHGKELIVKGGDGEEVMINDVTSCVIRMPFKASTVHMKSVKDSTLVFAPIRTSLLMRDCENLTVVISAQQIRIHSSHQIRFYIEVCFKFPKLILLYHCFSRNSRTVPFSMLLCYRSILALHVVFCWRWLKK